MEGFSRIKDPMRLKRGDILYFPPADREPRLAVGLSTFSKMGISIGETRRSDNHVSRVRKMLVEHPAGRGFALMVGDTWLTRSYRTGEERFINLIGNDGESATDVLPRVRMMTLHAVPVPGEEPDGYECECMYRVLRDRALAHVKSLGVKWGEFFDGSISGANAERFLQSVFDGSPDRAAADALPDVPDTLAGYEDPSAPADGSNVEDLVIRYYGNGDNAPGDVFDHCFIRVRGKFPGECVKRGAVLVRPSERVLDTMAMTLVAPALRECAGAWVKRIEFVRSFAEGLHREMGRAMARPKAFMSLASRSSPKAAQVKRLLRESGKAFGHENRLQCAGDQRDADAVEASANG